jgi:hypothetical protein
MFKFNIFYIQTIISMFFNNKLFLRKFVVLCILNRCFFRKPDKYLCLTEINNIKFRYFIYGLTFVFAL